MALIVSLVRWMVGTRVGENVSVAVHGNVLSAVVFLDGLSAAELRLEELDHTDRTISSSSLSWRRENED